MAPAVDLRSFIRAIPDFPQPGILFRDITPLLADPLALATAIDGLARLAADAHVDLVIGAEARGFLLGPALAARLGAGFVPARKPGRLPHDAVSATYALEYADATLELHTDPVLDGAHVLVHDDLLATGGTANALCELVTRLGGHVVGAVFLIELADLAGRDQLSCPVDALITYGG
ncbi:MAG TPA: adenine phosphoribosyltransferase [Solirubrobacteraceae bacterium]|jgi:adenine phosphoribosyltransferase|nr:adenine phosphoribosyltransferase [Solirubrobacteraceae bacterium]